MGHASSVRRGWRSWRSVVTVLRAVRRAASPPEPRLQGSLLVESRSRGRFVLKTYGVYPKVGEVVGVRIPGIARDRGFALRRRSRRSSTGSRPWGAGPTWRCPSPCPCPTAPRRLRASPLGLELAFRSVGPAVGGGPGVLLDGGDGRLRGGVASRPREPEGHRVGERGLRAHTPRPHPYEPSVWWARRGPAAGGGGDGF